MTSELELKALRFAYLAHDGQFRKYTGEPYITHPIAVAGIIKSVTADPEVIAAALLHDVIEDTLVTREQIASEFSEIVAFMVFQLSRPCGASDREYNATLRGSDAMTQTIKAADILHNTSTIALFDTKFARTYLREKFDTLSVLKNADGVILSKSIETVNRFINRRGMSDASIRASYNSK